MEDFEVRQALAVIKERVNDIKKDVDWKQKMADEWNQANEEKVANGGQDAQSHKSYSKFVNDNCLESNGTGVS